jgi:hypothetical protein
MSTDLLIGVAPLTLVRLRSGTAQYVYAGNPVPTESVDAADAKRLVDEGYLTWGERVGESFRPVDPEVAVPSPGSPGLDAGPRASGLALTASAGDPGLTNSVAQQGDPITKDDPEPTGEAKLATEREAARAKLPADNAAPDGRASKAVWVEYGVAQGRDYEALNALSKDELQAELKPKG